MPVDTAIYHRFFQHRIVHGCHELGECPMSFGQEVGLFAFVFGPAIAFGIAAAVFSKRQRSWQSWLSLLGVLVLVHWTIMLTDRMV
jgi:hypothetical protein